MGSKNVQGSDNQRGNFYTGYNVSGKANQWHTQEYNRATSPPAPPEWSGITATGGTTSTHTNPDGILYKVHTFTCLLYTSPSPRDATLSRMPSSA